MSTSNITSEYDIQLNIKDNTKDAIRALEKGLSEVGSYAKKAGSKLDITESLNESQKAADAMIEKFHEMAKNSELDFDAISKAYSKNAKKAISDLERQYAGIKAVPRTRGGDPTVKNTYKNASLCSPHTRG